MIQHVHNIMLVLTRIVLLQEEEKEEEEEEGEEEAHSYSPKWQHT